MQREWKDLLDVIGQERASDHGFCNQPTSFKQYETGPPYYWDWEAEITLKLKALGYKVCGDWETGDGDSFGPLTRYVVVEKDGVKQNLVYG